MSRFAESNKAVKALGETADRLSAEAHAPARLKASTERMRRPNSSLKRQIARVLTNMSSAIDRQVEPRRGSVGKSASHTLPRPSHLRGKPIPQPYVSTKILRRGLRMFSEAAREVARWLRQ